MGYDREYCGGGGGSDRNVCQKSMSVKRLKQMGVIAGTQ